MLALNYFPTQDRIVGET